MHPGQPPLGWSPKTDSPQNARNRPTLAHQGWNDLGLHKSMYNRPVKGIHNFTSLPFLSPVHLSLSLSAPPRPRLVAAATRLGTARRVRRPSPVTSTHQVRPSLLFASCRMHPQTLKKLFINRI
jgi:hypothetical protein